MAYAIRRLSLGALALTGFVACGGADANTRAQTPATTTTTAATTNPADTMPPPASTSPSEGNLSTGSPAQLGGADAPVNLATPPDSTRTGITTNGPLATATPPDGKSDSAVTNDAQISAVVDAANNGEMAQAREAISKAKDPRVKQFAHHMVTDHGQAEDKLRSIDRKDGITPQDSATSAQIKQGGDRVMANLHSANGSDFDKAYMDAQVDEHQKVLDLLDRFIPQAQSKDLQAHLKDVRVKVAGHLKMATDIRGSLKNP